MIYFVNEDGNTQLKGVKFYIPSGIKQHLIDTLKNYKETRSDFTVDGYKRLNNLIKMDGIEYNEMKRLKNYFDTYLGNGEDDTFKLNGGNPMKNWVTSTLDNRTKQLRDGKKALKQAKSISTQPIKPIERKHVSKSVQSPTVPKLSTNNMSASVSNNNIVKYDSIASTSKINEMKVVKLDEEQVSTLKLSLID